MKVVTEGVTEVEKGCFKSQEGLVERQPEVDREGKGGSPGCGGNCDEKRESGIVRCILRIEKKNQGPVRCIYSKIIQVPY